MNPTSWHRDPREREADHFAACFLTPAKLVRRCFEQLFLTDRFALDEATAFALDRTSLDAVRFRRRTVRDVTLALARATSYGGIPKKSLVELFDVTPTAMAYRLEELDLVADPSASAAMGRA